MRNYWVRFGCFLTGYNYRIVMNSSEIAVKAVKRYTSAILIVCILWAFIGYVFTERYLHANLIGSIFGALILVFIIVQVERQIILSIKPTKALYISRGLIAVMMAIIGTIIIDQIIFKEDIELEKATFIQRRVDILLPAKTGQLQKQINDLDSAIKDKEVQLQQLTIEIGKQPNITVYNTQVTSKTVSTTIPDSITGKPKTVVTTNPQKILVSSSVPNPQAALIDPLQKSIDTLRSYKMGKDAALLDIRPSLEKEISAKVGFLDELEVMFSLITKSSVALIVWFIWFFFLMGLELLVLVGKINEKEDDYGRTIQHQMDLQIHKLELFARTAKQG